MVDKIIGGKGFGPLGNINPASKAGAAKKPSETTKTDRVDFSSALQNANKTQATGTTQETSRADKIQALKTQIENGVYKPDLNEVATSLLPFLLKDS